MKKLLLLAFVPGLLLANVRTFTGMADASGAFVYSNQLYVVGDEFQAMQVYALDGANTKPVRTIDLDAIFPNNPDPKHPERDFEGLALRKTPTGGVVYLIGSHSTSKKGKSRPARRFFGALTLSEVAGPPGPTFTRLGATHGLFPGEGDINIEGIAVTDKDQVLFGFRKPENRMDVLLNPQDVLTAGRAPQWAKREDLPGAVTLGAIRDLLVVGDKTFILESGNKLFCNGKPVAWEAPAKFNAEVVTFNPATQQLVLLSDDGEHKIEGVSNKKMPRSMQTFRMTTLPLPAE